MDCPRPIKSVLCRFYPTWLSRTRPSMRIQRSEGLGSRQGGLDTRHQRYLSSQHFYTCVALRNSKTTSCMEQGRRHGVPQKARKVTY